MSNLEINLKNVFQDRLNQVKSFADVMKIKNEKSIEILKEIQSKPDSSAEEVKTLIIDYRREKTMLVMMQQNIVGIAPRLVELYTLAKISNIDLELDERDTKFITETEIGRAHV